MNRLKVEAPEEEEFIDVSGDDPNAEIPPAPHIIRGNRFKRPNRGVNLRRRQLDPDLEEELIEELNADDAAGDLLYEDRNDELEMEIESDVQMVRRTRVQRVSKTHDFADHGPVEFRFDSTQRKKQVLVHNSIKFPGRASEWYFARKNNTTQNETYRCVQCRRYREERKRHKRNDVPDRPEARIIVQMDRFLTNPDEPLGEHICDFETNERTLLHAVWMRRALNKANSELRMNPAKPKVKFDQLVEEIRHGSEYAHLADEVREKIIENLTTPDGDPKKGFASRRRSFARNNRFAHLVNGVKADDPDEADRDRSVYSDSVIYFLCGMPRCNERFENQEERRRHRIYCHPGVLFIDNSDDLKAYNSTYRHGNMISGEELVVADEQVVSEEMKADMGEGGDYDYIVRESLDAEQEEFLNQVGAIQERLRDEVEVALGNAKQRETLLQHMQECLAKVEASREELMPEMKVFHEPPAEEVLEAREELNVEM